MDYENRIMKVRNIMSERNIDALFLPPSGDRQYITGFETERPCMTHHHRSGDWLDGVLITQDKIIYIAPKMIEDNICRQIEDKKYIDDIVVLPEGEDYNEYAKMIIDKFNLRKSLIAVTKNTMAKTLINFLKISQNIEFVNTETFTCQMRMIKEPEELDNMRAAAKIADDSFLEVVGKIKKGMTEYEISSELNLQMKKRGAECPSFATDVMIKNYGIIESLGSGLTRVEKGCNIAFDFGAVYKGYCSDFGRTVYFGEPSIKYKNIHKLVMNSQQAAVDAIVPGAITAVDLDKIARDVINSGGYGKEFHHRLGHGIGIDVHEYPYLNKGYSEIIREGMTLTIEPSVVIKGEFRIRVEDVFHVTKEGAISLNNVTKNMIVLD